MRLLVSIVRRDRYRALTMSTLFRIIEQKIENVVVIILKERGISSWVTLYITIAVCILSVLAFNSLAVTAGLKQIQKKFEYSTVPLNGGPLLPNPTTQKCCIETPYEE